MTDTGKTHPPAEADASHYTLFEVGRGRVLFLAGYEEGSTRADCYDSEAWRGSPQALADAMDSCQPLAWEVLEVYSDSREELAAELEAATKAGAAEQARAAALAARLATMPEYDDEAAGRWLLGLSNEEFEARVVPRIEAWFNAPPDWSAEEDHLPEDATAQGAAVAFFRDLTEDELECLGVEVVEGENPGSSYYAAELRCSVAKANREAEEAGIPVRFVRG